MMYDFLIVGAGYSGCVLAERIANELDKKVLLIDKRHHIAGNAYDELDKNGILIHRYGPHLFHTKMKKVWDYLSQFTEWRPYEHRVFSVVNGKKVPVPFNFNSIEICFTKQIAEKLIKILLSKYEIETKIPILKLLETSDKDLKALADFIYENIFLGYNLKQWGLRPEELDRTVSGRVPVFLSRDNRYFQDQYQAVPKYGYTKMFEKMINNKNIEILLNTEYKSILNNVKFNKIIFTGPIDEFYDYKFGKLPYRSLEFEYKTLEMEYFQEFTQINYPNDFDYTRITEFKHITGQEHQLTTIAYEYPKEYVYGKNDPYYPIPSTENHNLFDRYKQLAESEKNVYFTGRLANYKYYNMDETVGVALQLFNNVISKV